jgi:DNA-binding PadR family transcriptional regulator
MITHNVTNVAIERNPAELAVLGFLTRGPCHGYDLARTIEAEIGPVWKLGRSQVYALLERLERDGLVAHRRIEQGARPPRKVYGLSRRGRALGEGWIASPVARTRELRLEFLAKLHLATTAGRASRARLVRAQRKVLEGQAADVRGRLGRGAGGIEANALTYRLAMVEAAMAWLETL